MSDIRAMRELLHHHLGGQWHVQTAHGRLNLHDAEDFAARGEVHDPMRAITGFYSEPMPTERGLKLTEKLGALGIHAEGATSGKTMVVSLALDQAVKCKDQLSHEVIKHGTIAKQIDGGRFGKGF